MDAYTLSGKMISLQEPALKSGGEGAVYNIIGYHNVVAKIYLSKADAREREEKIREMSGISGTESFRKSNILDDIAWPLAPLFNKAKEFIGFGMQRIAAANELDDIYSLSKKNNSGMTTYERVTTLISLCKAVGKLHKYGQVFGDFNPNNIKIDNQCRVKFVDADSYHFNSGRKLYPCVVCAPGYVAPELIKKCKGTTYAEYQGITFTRETDNFSLAVHCFRMLMNGCHPFSCKRHVKNVGSTPAPSIDKRVEKGETPFFTNVANFTTPGWAPDISCLPPYIRRLFEKAFVEGYANPSARPGAAEWEKALEKYRTEIQPCKAEPLHWYWKQLNSCPYCTANARGRKNLMDSMTAACRNRIGGNGGHLQNTVMPNSQANGSGMNTPKSNVPKVNIPKTNASSGNGANAGGTGSSVFYTSGAVPYRVVYNGPSILSSIPKKKQRFGAIRALAGNTALYWVLTMLLALVTHGLLGMYVYAPLYLKAGGAVWIEWVGAAGSALSGIAGTVIYSKKWSPARKVHPCRYKWYDYILSWASGIGFAAGFGIVFFIAAFAVVILLYILAAIFVVSIIIAVVSGLSSG